MNFIGLIGNLTADPEVRTTQSNVTVCSFRLAVQREFKNPETGKRDADFFQIAAWRQLGELCGKYLRKGKKACVVGHLESRSYVDKDGVKRYTVEVVADHVEFLSPRPDSGYETSRQEEKYPDFPYQEGESSPLRTSPSCRIDPKAQTFSLLTRGKTEVHHPEMPQVEILPARRGKDEACFL